MSMDQAGSLTESFADNWAYLKAELVWLDRVLMLAVAKQRKDSKDVDRVAQSKADRATSHWWKGILALEGNVAYDEHRQPAQSTSTAPKVGYQQQMDQRIKLSRDRGIVLALPHLCDRLNLTLFEKNLVLMSLAPELNRRYARLYRFLQGEDAAATTDLPSLDLVLRLLCRNDSEWRVARNRVMGRSPLTQHRLLQLLPGLEETRLNSSLKLQDALVDYLIAEQPTREALESLLQPEESPKAALHKLPHLYPAALDDTNLVLPTALLASLRYLVQQVWGYSQAEKCWEVHPKASPGKIVLFTGAAGTGKTMVAHAIAHALQTPLFQIDLAQVSPDEMPELVETIDAQTPTVLLVKSAQRWLGRAPCLAADRLHHLFAQRRKLPCLTLLSTERPTAIALQWRQQFDHSFAFPPPEEADRLRLWKQAFPSSVPLNSNIKWKELAKQLVLNGGMIQVIAEDAIAYAAAIKADEVEMEHILHVLTQRGINTNIKLSKKRR
ncbi:AAA family ATPase [Phormidium tenue FACHB-886]|nr:AAA family ATPase [Phormidium tenue FACHB-886]